MGNRLKSGCPGTGRDGTWLAPEITVPTPTSLPACHWGYVQGPIRGGRVTRSMVWICEHPFRTIRLGGPCEDCKSCRSSQGAKVQEVQRFDPSRGPQVA